MIANFLPMFLLKDCSSSEEYSIAAALLPLTTAFYRVSFSYSSFKTTPILCNFSLHIVKRKKVMTEGAWWVETLVLKLTDVTETLLWGKVDFIFWF